MDESQVKSLAARCGIPVEPAQFAQGEDMVGSHSLTSLVEFARTIQMEVRFELARDLFPNGDRTMTMDQRSFTAGPSGYIQDNNFDFDAGLSVTGDFVRNEKQQYAEMIAAALNSVSGADKKLGRAAPDPATRALFDHRPMNLDEVAQQDREWLANLKDHE